MNLDLRLSSALHALLHLAGRDEPVTSSELGRCLRANPVVVRRTMAGLRDAGLVHTAKGRGGGWSIHRELAAITIHDVRAALGSSSVFAVGFRKDPECLVEQAVKRTLEGALGEAEALLVDRLGAITLDRLAADLRGQAQAHRGHHGARPALERPPTATPPVAFDAAHAEAYDRNVEPLLPIKGVLHLMIRAQLAGLPENAQILVVGAGTGAEARFLAPILPRWRFTLVDPSAPMLEVARRHAVAEGFADRCRFHVGPVSSLAADSFDAATSVLVSHFLTSAAERQSYFEEIQRRLKPGGLLFEAALCADLDDPSFDSVMDLWLALSGMPDERKGTFRAAFGKGLAAHGPAEVGAIVTRAGFTVPVPCVQAALIRAWIASRPLDP